MTIGSDNLSNGSATAQDRFSGGVSAYRQNRRDAGVSTDGDNELSSRSSSSSGLPTRSPGRSHSIEPTSALDRAAKLPSLDLPALTEPVFPSSGWPDSCSSQSMAHRSRDLVICSVSSPRRRSASGCAWCCYARAARPRSR